MKRFLVIIGSIILSLLVTFFIGETFSIYHFGNIPTITTISYLMALFCIIEYIFLLIVYIFYKRSKCEKITFKKILGLVLFFIALIMILGFVVILDIDWLNHYLFSSPFYINVIVRSLEFLIPAGVLIIVGSFLLRDSKDK